ncbi:MAG TPA: VOC family virulence protein [Octadecabacter sp.]|nr:VOC family virulence protein [Octadecabacter sp.]
MPKLKSLDHLVLTVASIDATATFYETVLGMKANQFVVADGTKRTALSYGDQKINLHQTSAEFTPHAMRPTAGSADLCFLTDTPIPDWITHFATLDVPIQEGPITRTGATGPILSIYIRDPDGNLIEIATKL